MRRHVCTITGVAKLGELSGWRTMPEPVSPPPTGRLPTEIKITPRMIRAGVAAYLAWDPNKEEVEGLVASVFLTMRDEAMPTPPAEKARGE